MDEFDKSIKLLKFAGYEVIAELTGNTWIELGFQKDKDIVWLFRDGNNYMETLWSNGKIETIYHILCWSLNNPKTDFRMNNWMLDNWHRVFSENGMIYALDKIYDLAIDEGLINE